MPLEDNGHPYIQLKIWVENFSIAVFYRGQNHNSGFLASRASKEWFRTLHPQAIINWTLSAFIIIHVFRTEPNPSDGTSAIAERGRGCQVMLNDWITFPWFVISFSFSFLPCLLQDGLFSPFDYCHCYYLFSSSFIYISPDQCLEILSDYAQQCMLGRKLQTHAVIYDCSNPVSLVSNC